MGICTHCGNQKSLTKDHVFPQCLFIEPPHERGIKAPSCPDCNNKAEEGLLKSFFSLFDERLAVKRLGKELLHPKGRGDLRSFVRICTPNLRVAYPEERVTRLLKKVFQGLRRHILENSWTFLAADELAVFSLERNGDHQYIRNLPQQIGGPNEPYLVPPAFELKGDLGHSFGDFRFGQIEDDIIGLKYARTFQDNELVLCALSVPRRAYD